MYCIYISKCIICHNVSLTSFMKTSIRVVSPMSYARHARLLCMVLSDFVPGIWYYATCTMIILRCFSASEWSRLGVGVTKPIFSIPLFSQLFRMTNTVVTCMISSSCLAGVTAAQLRRHLANINMIEISDLYFCKIEISCNGEINERSFSNPHPRSTYM